MATFVFVHGTFAKKANWPLLQDGLSETATSLNEQAYFEQVPWSGSNHTWAREQAARDILKVVESAKVNRPQEKIFLIGHSHGGSAIAYFLKAHASATANILGAAFLSTPFVAIRSRLNGARQLTTFGLFLCAFSILGIVTPLSAAGFQTLALLTIAVITVTYFAFGLFASMKTDEVIADAIGRQTTDIPSGNYLFLRCSGDEAAAALSASQFIVWASVKFARLTDVYLKPLYVFPMPLVFTFGPFLALLISVSFGLSTFVLVMIIVSGREAVWLLVPFALFVGDNFWIDLVFVVLLFGLSFLLLATAVGTIIFFTAQAFCSWVFGWTGFLTGLLVEFAIEPLPFGDHRLVHVDWSSGLSGADMVHSWTYSHPEAIEHIKQWVVTTLKRSYIASSDQPV
jgi:pimeloyl-ACP methyl ester carboxylesterase